MPNSFKNYVVNLDRDLVESKQRQIATEGASMRLDQFDIRSPNAAYRWLEVAKIVEKSNSAELQAMFQRRMEDMVKGDREYDEMFRAFTYGIQLNRSGRDVKSWMERYWERFERRDMQRRIKLLNEKKGSSICGDRDTLMFTKRNDKRNLLQTDAIEEN